MLDLDLKGVTVLTEAGSNHYLYTPLIPLLAGASHVHIWIRDTAHGKAHHIAEQVTTLLNTSDIPCDRWSIHINERNTASIANSQVITNSYMIRPLDGKLLEYAARGCVIPLMWEAWELREEDIDLSICRAKGIKVAGTNEKDPRIHVFESAGFLAVKMLMESRFPVEKSSIVVWSDDAFGEEITTHLKSRGYHVEMSIDEKDARDSDILFLTDYSETRSYFKGEGLLDTILQQAKKPRIVHLYGEIDIDYCSTKELSVFPARNGHAKKMTFTFDYLGYEPLLRLQTGSFKVAECMLKGYDDPLVQYIVQ
jgi:hypothetical protein